MTALKKLFEPHLDEHCVFNFTQNLIVKKHFHVLAGKLTNFPVMLDQFADKNNQVVIGKPPFSFF